MARRERTEAASLPIWLKLSEADAAQMERVLARPEFAGWTRAEWCLEIIQTALRYYARRDNADEPGREHASARPAAAAPEPRAAPPEPRAAAPEPGAPPAEPAPAAKPRRAAAKARRAAPKAKPAAARAKRPTPEAQRAAPGRASEPAATVPEPSPAAPEPIAEPEPVRDTAQAVAEEPESLAWPECSHPADARDYQTGTCAACGAILWD